MKRSLRSFALAAQVMLLSGRGYAESSEQGANAADPGSAPTPSAGREEAALHFERALSLYRSGRYRGALPELERAVALDPQGKDLVYNLALVREKLGDYDGAIDAFRRLSAMEHEPLERERIEQALVRLEGARDEQRAVLLASSTPSAPAPRPISGSAPAVERCQRRGRFDAWVLGSGIVSAAAAVLGTVYGIRAISLDPSGESTGPGKSFADLRAQAVRARHAALIADVSFGVSIAAGITGATLYLGRSATPTPLGARMSGAWLNLAF